MDQTRVQIKCKCRRSSEWIVKIKERGRQFSVGRRCLQNFAALWSLGIEYERGMQKVRVDLRGSIRGMRKDGEWSGSGVNFVGVR